MKPAPKKVTVKVEGSPSVRLDVLGYPDKGVAHPGECGDGNGRGAEPCHLCLLAIRPDTGDILLVWEGDDTTGEWSLSPHTPELRKHEVALRSLGGGL